MRNHNKEKSNEHTGWQMQREQLGAGGADTGDKGGGADPARILGTQDHYARYRKAAGKASKALPPFPFIPPERLRRYLKKDE